MPTCRLCGRELPDGYSAEVCPDCVHQQQHHSFTTAAAQTPMTSVLIAVNVAWFIAMVLRGVPFMKPSGPQVLFFGANFGPASLGDQWWRLVTAQFVHIGAFHLLLNMWCLWELGRMAERLFGRFTFLAGYLACGIAGGLLSVAYRPLGISAGASGAVFGIAGALITTLKFGHLPISREAVSHTLRSLVAFAGYNLVFGFISPHIDNAAHIGGLVCGLVLGSVMSRDFRHPLEPVNAPRPSPLPQSPAPARELSSSLAQPRFILFAATSLLLLATWFGVRQVKWPVLELARAQENLRLGRRDLAIRQLQRIIERRPSMQDAYFTLGSLYMAQERHEDAARLYQRLIQAQPASALAWEQLGIAYINRGQQQKALEAFQKVTELKPRDATAYFNLGLLYQQGDDCAHAVPAYEKAGSLNPELAVVPFNLGLCQMALRNYTSAVASLQRAAQLRDQDPSVHQWLGNAYAAKGLTAEANAAYARAADLRRNQRQQP